MEFKNIQTAKYPLSTVWPILRDHLPEIVSAQDDIEYVKVEKRSKKAPDSVHVISTWKADPPLPSFLKSVIKPDMLIWTDDAVWSNADTTCRFTIKTRYQLENIHCEASIQCEAAGAKSTKITYSGVLTIERTPRSSIFMTGFIIRGIEALAGTLIERNFSKTVKSLEAYIREQK